MEQKAYIRAVMRALKCSGTKKKEIRKQLESDIGIALEEGRPVAEVLEEMGSAAEVAVLLLGVGIFLYWWLPKAKWVGPDGGDKESRAKEQAQLSTDWGERVSVGTGYVVELSQQGQMYQVVELQVVYENVSVIYSITLDEELRLAGLYMR